MRTLVPVLALFVSGACGAPAGEPAPQPQRVRIQDAGGEVLGEVSRAESPWAAAATLKYPIDRVWATLPGAYDSLGIAVTLRDAAARTAGNPGFRVRRQLGRRLLHEYIDCGRTQGAVSADSYEIRLSVVTRLEPATQAGGTALRTIVEAQGKPMSVSGNWVPCASEGTLEGRLVATLIRLLEASN